jgi:hypothetical protein
MYANIYDYNKRAIHDISEDKETENEVGDD